MHRRWVVGLFVIFLTGCSGFFYYPDQKKHFSPDQMQLKVEDVYFESPAGDRIHGWWFEAQKTKPLKGTIIFFHGNAQNISSHFLNLSWMPQEGYNFFIFDYPGYGESSGSPNPKSCLLSAKAAVSWVFEKKKPEGPIFIFGQSLGGNIALRTALEIKDQFPIKAIIVDSTFLSYQQIAKHKLSQNWITWLLQPLSYVVLSDRWAPKEIHRLSPIPLLVIHGQSDIVVEPRWGEDIYNRAEQPKEIWRVPGGTHGDLFWAHGREYRKKVLDWLKKYR